MNNLDKLHILLSGVQSSMLFPFYLLKRWLVLPCLAFLHRKSPKPRLAVSYNFFDGEELLEDSILSVREVAQHVSVVFQTTSHWGRAHPNPRIHLFLESLVTRGLVDSLIEFNPNHEKISRSLPDVRDNVSFHQYDVAKRNMGLQDAISAGCNLYLSLDADELYVPKQLDYMAKEIHLGNWDFGVVQHVQYWRTNTYIKFWAEQEFVSGVIKIRPDVQFQYGYPTGFAIDPARSPNSNKIRRFRRFEVTMHHMSMVRLNIAQKYLNHGAQMDLASEVKSIERHYKNWTYPERGLWPGQDFFRIRRIRPKVKIVNFLSLQEGQLKNVDG